MSATTRRLYRSVKDRKIWGVCGGLGDYFGMDPVIMRVIFVVLIFASGAGLLIYLILAAVTPSEPSPAHVAGVATATGPGTSGGEPSGQNPMPNQPSPQNVAGDGGGSRPMSAGTLIGIILVIVGLIILFANLNLFGWFKFSIIGPLILVALGLLLFFGRGRS
jgi:phage shock protein C